MNKRMYVLTGGPGVGKTTTLQALAARGRAIIPEAARAITEEEEIKGSNVVPWGDVEQFQYKVVERQLQEEEAAEAPELFLDRSIIDSYAYSEYGAFDAPPDIERLARGRYAKVFMLDPLPGYANDPVRRETAEFNRIFRPMIEAAYRRFGYEPVRVPVLPPGGRADFILKKIYE